MASKVEELRKKIKQGLYDGTPNISYGEEIMLKLVDSLISAAHAEGAAEGAAVGVSATRRQLRAASASITKQEGTRSIGGIRHYLIPVRAFSVPIASVLAPKEAEHDKG